ncbi:MULTISPECIES: GNAT family N-acetyltransferase [Streptomyces]|uniref:GNAT family N-acetyltransferase n=1 Tax=Streptomyces lycii TaxID=2654337 RepID=A0ABQ7FNE9_9ACTN|nr:MULTISPECIES: GNAT family N-acetyltransferase [Streptomyces]KAF4409159.1 GNAT family N-acetyltransferase [Streptomyces lycii]PGH47380.1 GNAT family N-acetyltransferase [Streptomyces sp. Ru87]
MDTVIRAAGPEDAPVLSELALRSKGYWGYDRDFLELCRAELTLDPAETVPGRAAVAEAGGRTVGFYALGRQRAEVALAHLFVEPDRIGCGIGRLLWEHAVAAARAAGSVRVSIDADPFAEPFYRAMGARPAGTVPSGSVPGRMLPLLVYDIPAAGTPR